MTQALKLFRPCRNKALAHVARCLGWPPEFSAHQGRSQLSILVIAGQSYAVIDYGIGSWHIIRHEGGAKDHGAC